MFAGVQSDEDENLEPVVSAGGPIGVCDSGIGRLTAVAQATTQQLFTGRTSLI